MKVRLHAATTIALVLTTGAGWCAEWTVLPDGSGDFATIQAAIDAASHGDTIVLGDGTFTGDGNRDILVAFKSLKIHSLSGDPTKCVIDCTDGDTELHGGIEFRFTGGEPVLRGVTITDGRLDDFCLGAGLRTWQSSPRIEDCIFTNNVTGQGGAINFQESSPTLINCVVAENHALRFTGGGIFSIDGTFRAVNCTIYGNSATLGGGGVAAWRTVEPIRIENTIISGNSDAAVFCDGANLEISCSNIFGNTGGDWIDCISDQMSVMNNLSVAPRFCAPSRGDYSLQANSPCAPRNSAECGLIGARDVGCEPVSVAGSSWSAIKARYAEKGPQ